MANINRNLFKGKADLIAIIPSVVMALCCFVALLFIEGQIVGQVVTAITGVFCLLILGYIYLIRYLFTKPTYITKHGIHVVHGKKNKPSKEEFEKWTQNTIDHWVDVRLTRLDNGQILTREEIEKALENIKCFFADTRIIGSTWLWVRGIKKKVNFLGLSVRNVDIYVGYGDTNYVRLVTKHELGHPLLGLNSFSSGANFGGTHHRMYKEYKFDCA